jgi:SAM-dependent MidA family methyltransferase
VRAGNTVLVDYIRRAIRDRGLVTFEWFMDQALYHPKLGYYSGGGNQIGRRGDYFTNVSVGPLFGRILAVQFAEMWETLGQPADFVIVEQGAHTGDFAVDVLRALQEQFPDFFAAVRYWIVEPFQLLRERQQKTIKDFSAKTVWRQSLADLEQFCGVFFSNELLDSMAVHLVSWVNPNIGCSGDWEERCVVESGKSFNFITSPIQSAELQSHLERIPRPGSRPYETEVNLNALKWVEEAAQKLSRGYLLTADYGYSRDEFYRPERSNGTLQCRSGHRIVSSPFIGIGEADITAHVDWTSVAERAERSGLALIGFTDQHHFLTGIITTLMADQLGTKTDAGTRRELQALLHPELLGTTFQFLGLTKNVISTSPLSGFKFARNSRSSLGL